MSAMGYITLPNNLNNTIFSLRANILNVLKDSWNSYFITFFVAMAGGQYQLCLDLLQS